MLQCRNFGDFWGKKAPGGSSVTLLPNQVSPPVVSSPAGTYAATQNITLTSATPAATFCYTTDGITTPVCDAATATCTTGTTYAAAISVTSPGATVMTLACVATMINSPLTTAAYVIDTTAPVISATAPTSAAYATTAEVSYTFSENCASGSVTWTQTGGNPDPGSPRVQALVGAELTAIAHTNATLTNNPALVDGATYSVKFDCTDAAGNAATPVTATGVTYDAAVPVISAIAPTNGAFVNTTQVSYTLSETCSSGNVTWTRTGGSPDAGSPHVQALSGVAELIGGAHTNVTLTNNPALVSGTIYDISFNCTDNALRAATTVTSTSVTFDNVIPVISAVAPINNSYINNSQVSYTLSETCNTAAITWTQTGGATDLGSPHVQALMGAELSLGAHTNITIANNPTLISGAIYSIMFTCLDASGNSATPVTVTNITFDNISIVISAVTPASNAYRNVPDVAYTLSETCYAGTVTWTQTGGAADPSSPHIATLTGAELDAGAHGPAPLANSPILIDGAIYSVQFDCTDFASNPAIPILVTNVTYDFTAPVISGISPTTAAFINTKQVSYTLSENCATGNITWTQTGGAADGLSPHVQSLMGGELTAGTKTGITITNVPSLVNASVYTVAFNCTDAAGNAATVVSSTGITYDDILPIVSIQNLRDQGTVNTGQVIGPATDNVGVTLVEFSLDGGAWTTATFTPPNWKFALPMGGATWPDRSLHTIKVQARDAAGNIAVSPIINVRKGNNQDINGDGYADVALSGWKWTTGTGRAYIYYGSNTGIASGSATAAPKKIDGQATNNFFSRSMVLADFNGDGFADLAAAAYGNTTNTGKVYIFNGSPGGISPTLAASASLIISGGATNDQFGSVVNAGDSNNDGYADLVIAANGASTNSGKVYIYLGSPSGVTGTTAAAANATLTGETSSQFGSSTALGDFNSDGKTDLAVSAIALATNTGRCYIFYGNAGGIGSASASTANSIANGEATANYFGSALSAGDVNKDGATDLIVGAYGFSGNTGKLYLYYGSTGAGIATGGGATPSTLITGNAGNAYFTTSISAADMNSDGFADVIVGEYGPSASLAGAARIFYGQATPLASGLSTSAPYSALGETIGDFFGRGIGAFDFNGDGYQDLIVGANMKATSDGAVYGFLSGAAGPSATTATTANTTITGELGQAAEFGIHISR